MLILGLEASCVVNSVLHFSKIFMGMFRYAFRVIILVEDKNFGSKKVVRNVPQKPIFKMVYLTVGICLPVDLYNSMNAL